MNELAKLSIVVPCYNEADVLPETNKLLVDILANLIKEKKINKASYILYVDDGSNDNTWSIIENISLNYLPAQGIKLSRNRGHQNALLAGLLYVDADAVISVDADMQDDLEAIPKMIDAFNNGFDIVYGVRNNRSKDKFLKRFTAESYYRLLSWMNVEIIFNHADYRLLSRRAIEALKNYPENNIFLRGIIPQLGFPSASIYYIRNERFSGKSKYSLRKMLSFGWEGITSFSAAPLRIITTSGILISAISFLITIWAIAAKLFLESTVPGWASTVVPMYFLGGVQLLAIGIIGEYLAKIYLETKNRPRYFIERKTKEKTTNL